MDESTTWWRHPDIKGQAFLSALFLTLAWFLIAPSVGDAQVPVVTDITSSGPGTVVQPPSDGVYNITGGTRPGDGPNLFHSFGDFSIGSLDTANFLNTPVNGSLPLTSNILGRVTGGNVSNIYGTIQITDFGNANLFLMNPSGIVLGPTGSVNVTGSVSFTTAQYLSLSDGGNSANFYADLANDGLANSVLAVAPVVDFGFLSPAAYGFLTPPDPNATITVQGSALAVLQGQSISLVGGKVIIESGTPDGGTAQLAQLSAPNGTIHFASTASPGELDVATLGSLPNVDGVSFTAFGSVSLLPGSSIDVSGANTVFVKNGQLVLSVNDATFSTSESPAPSDTISLNQSSSIITSNSGAEPGADVQIIVGNLNLDGAGTAVTTQVFGDGNGGNITANVGSLSMANGAVIQSQNFSVGTDFDGDGGVDVAGIGGDVIIQGLQGPGSPANSFTLDTFAAIKTETLFGLGRGGDVSVTADRVRLDNTSEVLTNTFLGNGVGGNLDLNVGTVMLNGGSAIRTTELTFGIDSDFDGVPDPGSTGSGGHVTIQGITGSAADFVLLSGGSQIKSESLGSGDGGRLFIGTASLILDGASTLDSRTDGIGRGGDIVVNVQQASFSGGATIVSRTAALGAGGTIIVQGLDGDGIKAKALTLAGFLSGILSESEGSGRPGDIEVHAKTVSLTDRAAIEAGTTESNGTGGKVSIDADSVSIAGGSLISSQAFAQDAGQVTVTADQLSLDNGSIVTATASVFGGRGGDVVLDVGAVSLANGTTINSSTSQTGRAGNITMNVGTMSLANGSEISSASTGTDAITTLDDGTTQAPGTAGNVVITATGSFISDGSTVATLAEANHGGDVYITAHSVQLSNGTLITANSNAPFQVTKLVLDQNGQLVTEVVGDGNAGNITVHSGSTFVMSNSSMTTKASQASGGQIVMTAPEMVRLTKSQVNTTVAGSETDTAGGDIMIDPQFVVLQNSQVLAQAFAGTGGNITIISNVFLADPSSSVNASSQLGISGQINIQSPVQNVGGELTPMPQEFSSAAALLAQQCAARVADGKFSTFVLAGREGLPVEPGGFLASPSWTAEPLGSRLSGQALHTQLPTVKSLFPKYDARPIQMAKFGGACR